MEKFKNNLFAIIGFIALAIVSYYYTVMRNNIDVMEFAGVMGIFTFFYTYLLFIYEKFVTKPSENKLDNIKELESLFKVVEEKNDKYFIEIEKQFSDVYSSFDNKFEDLKSIEGTITEATNILIKKQQIIDQKLLGLIEKQAKEVWVISTNLATEINDSNLQNDIFENFKVKSTLRYTYFIPHPDSSFDEVQSNLKSFKQLDFYKEFQDRIDIIPLPAETQFLLEEVVIYNPHGKHVDIENDKEYSGINGFTYYNQDGKNLHMKLDIKMLRHLTSNLEKKLSGTRLTLAVEKIFVNFGNDLTDNQSIYLSSLLSEKNILDKSIYNDFIKSFENRHPVKSIQSILSRFITFKK